MTSALAKARELPQQLPAVLADAADVTPEELQREQELARLGWMEAGYHTLVSTAWFAASLSLGALANAAVHYGNAVAVLIMSGAFAGLLAPAAITGVRRVNAEFSDRRLALDEADDVELAHLSARLRALFGSTRVALAAVDGHGIAGQGRDAVWRWLSDFEGLDESDLWELDRRGLDPAPVRRILLTEDFLFGALTRGQRRRILRQLRHFADQLSRPLGGPYR